jgi:hypothetical protein
MKRFPTPVLEFAYLKKYFEITSIYLNKTVMGQWVHCGKLTKGSLEVQFHRNIASVSPSRNSKGDVAHCFPTEVLSVINANVSDSNKR